MFSVLTRLIYRRCILGSVLYDVLIHTVCGPAFCRQYGPVSDVRIPCQERRMFGFVSFQNPETVSTILMRRNPHFICGARVLVKPYREKSRCLER